LTIVVEDKSRQRVDTSQLFSATTRENILGPRTLPRTAREIHELAKHMAFGIVAGYVEHDRGFNERKTDGFQNAVEGFFQVYLYCFPDLSPFRAHKAAELYVKSLFKQDEIENHPGHVKEEIVLDPRWDELKQILVEFSEALGLPSAYAEETTNFFKYHGVRDPRYVVHCIESERIFWTKVIGNEYWAKILGSLLIILTDCHDKHDPTGLQAGLQFATKYFEIVLKARVSAQPRTIVPSA
jgi:hypothetical protein